MHHSKPSPWIITGPCLAVLLALTSGLRADVKLPAIISDHMVLQRDVVLPIWGSANPGEDLAVTLAGQTKPAKADRAGKWVVQFDKLKAGEGLTLTVKANNTITVQDVLVGEVWLASGQSNMAMTVSRARDFDKEQAAAKHPQIRMFTVKRLGAREPQADCAGQWQVCNQDTVGTFSAAAYFFGRDLHHALHVPIGLIDSSVGGTPIEAWTSLKVQKARPELKALLASWDKKATEYNAEAAQEAYKTRVAAFRELAKKAKAEGKPAPRPPQPPVDPGSDTHHPAALFNGMIAPLVPFAIRGAIWYQGESNAGSAASGALYAMQLSLLVQDWRTRWGQGDFPFAWVQLPNFKTTAKGWPLVREGMLKSLSLPNTGMTVNIDLGEENDIHPKNKQDVGKRLALWARAQVYGEKIPSSGPLPAGHRVTGGTMELSFSHTDNGLVAKGGDLRGFVIAGADQQWKPAVARIEGNKVLVSSPEVKEPAAVRYAWASNPDGNLYNGADLPASPFRTDDWPATTP
jgi:hypothetical protein